MIKWLRLLTRLIAIAMGYLAACAIAALALIFGLMMAQSPGRFVFKDLLAARWDGIFAVSIIAFSFIFMFALLPAAWAIRYAERNRIRSFLPFCGGGVLIGVIGFVLGLIFKEGQGFGFVKMDRFPTLLVEAIIFSACGLAAGAGYWLIAGRRSGRNVAS